MARLARVEDRPTPPEVYNWKVYFNAIIATWAAVMIGYDSAFIGTSISLASFKSEFGLTTKSTTDFNFISANIVSVFQAGCFFGAFFGYLTGYFLGRKYGLLLSSAIFILGAGLQCGANSSTGLGIMYAGRIIVGFGIGIASNLAPIYVAEIAPPAIRGRLIGMYELCWQIGGVVGFWINYGVTEHIPASHKQWFIAFAVQLIPGAFLFIGSFFLVESPRWLVSRDRNADAIKNLAKLRNLPEDAPYVVEEYTEIEAAIAHERGLAGAGFFGPMKTVFASKTLRYRVLLGSSLFVWQNGTGINAINYYSPTIFKSIGITGGNTSLLTTGVYGIIKLVGALVWLLYLVDTFGRRGVLLIGSIGGAISMYYIGAYIAIAKPAQHPTTKLSSGGQSAIAFFYIWTIFYGPTWNGTPWVVGAEMFPQHVRTFTQACQAASNWFWGFIITRFTPQMFTSMGYGVYIFFATLMVVSVPFIYFILPETKQVPLERMEELFAPGVKPWKAHDIVMARVHETRQLRNEGKDSPSSTSFEKNRNERAEAV
ncbi:general substrate transporter [Mycena albidolilacea]|uniref:Quinate transporter n=1 Tax=Mycena albidolilacea TaxID=1033008 RepID=A0AAD6Z0Z0_9AGAR|nr:general substrate transporter [Mycena albidolilacea]